MRALTRLIAATQLVLIFPAALFLTAVLVRTGGGQYDLAHVAEQIVGWYAARMWTLWLLLLALPLAALVAGCGARLRKWSYAEHADSAPHSLATISAPAATLFVAAMTLISAGILAVVVMHMAAN